MWLRDELAALKPDRSDLRKFSWVFGGALMALGAFAWYRGSGSSPYLLWPGLIVAAFGTIAPNALRGLYFVWMAIGLTLGAIVTRIILSLVFLVAVVPTGLIMRLLGKDPLQRELDPQAESYWIPKEYAIRDKSRLEKYF